MGRQLLLVAWAVLIGAIGGAVLWTHLSPGEEAGPREAVRISLPPAPPMLQEVPKPEPSVAAEAAASEPPPAEAAPAPAPAPAPEATPEPPAPVTPPPAQPGERLAESEPQPAAASAPDPQPEPPPAATPAAEPPAPPAAAAQTAMVTPPLPSVREAPMPAWLRFSRPFDANDGRPRVAVVVSDLGLSSAATTTAIQVLPGGVTLAFSPYADRLDHWIDLARAAGHEVLLNLPMEPINFPANDPGPRALLTSLSAQQNLDRLDWVLGRVEGYVGVTNHMGSRFTTMPEALKPVLTAIRERGLMFLDSRASIRSLAAKLATEIGLPRAINDRQIDQEASRPAIDGRLGEIERIAHDVGSAVAMAQPYPVTIERLQTWLPTLETKGLVLAPLTAIVNRQPDR